MRIRRFLVAGALSLAVLFAVSCSKSPNGVRTPPKPVDLGAIELTAEVTRTFTLGAHKSCNFTWHEAPDGAQIKVEVSATNAAGAIFHSLANVKTLSGHSCIISMGGEAVAFTPVLKNNEPESRE